MKTKPKPKTTRLDSSSSLDTAQKPPKVLSGQCYACDKILADKGPRGSGLVTQVHSMTHPSLQPSAKVKAEVMNFTPRPDWSFSFPSYLEFLSDALASDFSLCSQHAFLCRPIVSLSVPSCPFLLVSLFCMSVYVACVFTRVGSMRVWRAGANTEGLLC